MATVAAPGGLGELVCLTRNISKGTIRTGPASGGPDPEGQARSGAGRRIHRKPGQPRRAPGGCRARRSPTRRSQAKLPVAGVVDLGPVQRRLRPEVEPAPFPDRSDRSPFRHPGDPHRSSVWGFPAPTSTNGARRRFGPRPAASSGHALQPAPDRVPPPAGRPLFPRVRNLVVSDHQSPVIPAPPLARSGCPRPRGSSTHSARPSETRPPPSVRSTDPTSPFRSRGGIPIPRTARFRTALSLRRQPAASAAKVSPGTRRTVGVETAVGGGSAVFDTLADFGTAESVRLGPNAEVGGGGSGGDAKNGRDMKFTGFMAGNSLPGMPRQREVEGSDGAERRAIIRRKRDLKVDALAPSRNLRFSTPMDTLRRWVGLCRARPRSGRFRGTLRVGNRSCRKSPRILS